jgi:hypothetical protein
MQKSLNKTGTQNKQTKIYTSFSFVHIPLHGVPFFESVGVLHHDPTIRT